MRIVAFLPAKGSSERIENKNIELLDGKPLFVRALETLLQCPSIDEVCLDTESEQVYELAKELPIRWLKRDPSLASNDTDGHELLLNEVAQVEADIYVQMLCTSPFIEPDTIERGIAVLKEEPSYDSVVLVKNSHLYTWADGAPAYGTGRIPNSVTLASTTVETMGLYMIRREAALSTKRRFGDKPFLLEAKPIEAIDVNIPEEFALANFIASGKREQERIWMRNLRSLLTSPILSDILDDMGIDGVVQGLRPNIPTTRILGRAKTLRLRKLKDGEDFKGIYQALETYRTVIPNDVIMVENEVSDYAYFGDLNARLAMSAGAVGAVIAGLTRDANTLLDLGFPVFARGFTCRDVRGRATVDHFNRRIEMGGVSVYPGDLIFADADGVVVVPKAAEEEVIQRAVESIRTEANIGVDIALGRSVNEILDKHGAF